MEEEDEDDMAGPLPIEKLAEAGINTSDIKKLKAQGMFTIESVCFISEVGMKHISIQQIRSLCLVRLPSVPTNFSATSVVSVTQK